MTGRVVMYVDGFNLYNGLKDKHGRKYLWLDLRALGARLVRPDQHVHQVVYFSARVRRDVDAARRQATYIDALRTYCDHLVVIEGRFQEKRITCRRCGQSRVSYEEKETDVSIAVALVEDAVLDRYDTALLVSADSDLCPAVRAVRRLAPAKRVLAAFPPHRVSENLRRAVHGSFTIPDAKIRKSLLPDVVKTTSGVCLERPDRWR
jgi:hypothetical protein